MFLETQKQEKPKEKSIVEKPAKEEKKDTDFPISPSIMKPLVLLKVLVSLSISLPFEKCTIGEVVTL